MSDPDPPAPDEPEAAGPDRWIAPFFEDSTLWPVLIVVAAVFVTLAATGLLLAFVERNPFAVAAMLLAFWVSVDIAIRERRGGRSARAGASLAGLWALSILAALGMRWGGYF